MKPLRMEVKLRNNRLFRLRTELNLTMKELSEKANVQASEYGQLESLSVSPLRQDGEWRSVVTKIADFHGVSCEWLFPEVTQSILKNNTYCELDEQQVYQLSSSGFVPQILPGDISAAREAKDQVHNLLRFATERERLVLALRLGLDGERKHTLREVGEALGLGNERIRQIESKALWRIRQEASKLGWDKEFIGEIAKLLEL